VTFEELVKKPIYISSHTAMINTILGITGAKVKKDGTIPALPICLHDVMLN
jgi:hypothetical protein